MMVQRIGECGGGRRSKLRGVRSYSACDSAYSAAPASSEGEFFSKFKKAQVTEKLFAITNLQASVTLRFRARLEPVIYLVIGYQVKENDSKGSRDLSIIDYGQLVLIQLVHDDASFTSHTSFGVS